MQNPFVEGDLAVYPVHGITKVVELSERDLGGATVSVYILEVLENGSKIMVPTEKAAAVGLRKLVSSEELEEVMNLLRLRETVPSGQSWNRRKREYTDKLKTGNIFEVAEVMRDLSLLSATKSLSFSERRMLDTAKNLLVQEISLAKGVERDTISNELDSIFERVAA